LSDPRLACLEPIMASRSLDAIALVPGPNFRKLFNKSFYQNERPLVVVTIAGGPSLAIVPNLELASFAALDFDGPIFDWRDEAGYSAAFPEAARALKPDSRIGVEGQAMRVFVQIALQEALPAARIVDAHAAISAIRLHKTAAELDTIREAIRRSEQALAATLEEVRTGLTETEIEALLLKQLFACGSDGLAFAPIVAAGDNSAKPHAKARRDYRVKAGDALLFDFGASYDGYMADITRTVFVEQVSDRDRAFYDTVLAANAAGKAAVRPGVSAHEVDDTVQTLLEGSPFAEFRRHKTGHGLGLDVHEDPHIMRGNQALLEPGMVFTIEPGLYRLDECGVRIEDDVAVTEDGVTCLTSFPRELRIVG